MVRDIEREYYDTQGLRRKDKDSLAALRKQREAFNESPLPLSYNTEREFETEELELIYILVIRYISLLGGKD